MAYYGDPASLVVLNPNVKSLVDAYAVDPTGPTGVFMTTVAAYDALVTPVIVSRLTQVFRADSLPVPASTNDSLVSTLWLIGMTEEIQEAKFSASKVSGESTRGRNKGTKFEQMLLEIKSGRMVIDGAVRLGSVPALQAGQGGTARIIARSAGEPESPFVIAENWVHGLRY